MRKAIEILEEELKEMQVEIEQLKRRGNADIEKKREAQIDGIQYSIRILKFREDA